MPSYKASYRGSRFSVATTKLHARLAFELQETRSSGAAVDIMADALHFRVVIALCVISVLLIVALAVVQLSLTRATNDPSILVAVAKLASPTVLEAERASVVRMLKTGRLVTKEGDVLRFVLPSAVLEELAMVLPAWEKGDERGARVAVEEILAMLATSSADRASITRNVVLGIFATVVVGLIAAYFGVFRRNVVALKAQIEAETTALNNHAKAMLHEVEVIETIAQLGSVLMEEESVSRVMRLIVSRAADLTASSGGLLLMCDRSQTKFEAAEFVTARAHLFRGPLGDLEPISVRLSPARPSFLRRVCNSQALLRVDDAAGDDGFKADMDEMFRGRRADDLFSRARAVLGVPLFKGQRTMGVLILVRRSDPSSIDSSSTHTYSDRDEQLVGGVFASMAEQAIARAKEMRRIRSLKLRLQQILESIDAIVLSFGPDKRLLAASKPQHLLELLEVDDATKLEDITYDDLFQRHRPVIERLDATLLERKASNKRKYSLMRQDGSEAHLTFSVAPLPNKGIAVVLEDETESMRMRDLLGRYMSPALVDKVLGDKRNVLGGVNLKATVLFADIRGFTPLTEKLDDPQKVVALLNDHFNGIVEAVFAHGGTVDKFIGDAVMSVFGVPYPQPNDATNALLAVCDILRFLDEMCAARRAQGLPVLDAVIGVNTGTMLAGNIGNTRRMDYTVIGDAVNVASRLESATRQYSVRCLVSQSTMDAANHSDILFRKVDTLVVKGKTEPMPVYEILGMCSGPKAEEHMSLVVTYQEALNSYTAGDWARAAQLWGALAENDPCSAVMLKRIDGRQKPPDGFVPVTVMSGK